MGHCTGRDPRIYSPMSAYKNFNVIRIGCSRPSRPESFSWYLCFGMSNVMCARVMSHQPTPISRTQDFFALADWQNRRMRKAGLFVHKSASTLLLVKFFMPCHLYLSGIWNRTPWHMIRGNAYSQVGLVDVIDGSGHRFYFKLMVRISRYFFSSRESIDT